MAREELEQRKKKADAPYYELLDKMKKDPLWFMESKENFLKGGEAFLKIKDRETDRLIPWVCNNTQHMLLNAFFDCKAERRPVRLVVLKGRQQGCSTGVGAIGFMNMMCYIGANLLIATETKSDSGKNVYNMYRLYKDSFPIKPEIRHEVDGETIEYGSEMNNAIIRVTGERRVVSSTYKFIHLSEAAKFYDLDKFMDDMLETVPMHVIDTSIFVESTAEEYGDMFHELWEMAKISTEDKVGWQQLFIPWWIHEDYGEDNEVNGFRSEAERKKFAESLNDSEDSRYGDEVSLLNLDPIDIPIRHGETRKIGVTLENLKWRRGKIAEKKFSLVDFCRQYPSTPDEAFMHAITSPLDRKSLDWYTKERLHYPELTDEGEPHPQAGQIRVPFDEGEFFEKDEISNTFEFKKVTHPIVRRWEEVHEYRKYIVGVDMAQGLETGDFSCAVVICRLPLRVVAILRGFDGRRLDPTEFAAQLFALGQYYNNAIICPENNKDAGAVVRDLVQRRYPNISREETITGNSAGKRYGWNNNGTTHRLMLAELQRVIREKQIDIWDELIIEELKHLVYRPGRGGSVEAAKKGQRRRPGSSPLGYYDDSSFALGGALLLDSLLETVKTESQIRNEMKIANMQARIQDKTEEVFDENAWLNYA